MFMLTTACLTTFVLPLVAHIDVPVHALAHGQVILPSSPSGSDSILVAVTKLINNMEGVRSRRGAESVRNDKLADKIAARLRRRDEKAERLAVRRANKTTTREGVRADARGRGADALSFHAPVSSTTKNPKSPEMSAQHEASVNPHKADGRVDGRIPQFCVETRDNEVIRDLCAQLAASRVVDDVLVFSSQSDDTATPVVTTEERVRRPTMQADGTMAMLDVPKDVQVMSAVGGMPFMSNVMGLMKGDKVDGRLMADSVMTTSDDHDGKKEVDIDKIMDTYVRPFLKLR